MSNTADMGRELTAEQRRLIEQMSGSGASATGIDVSDRNSASMMSSGAQLTAAQLSSVVNGNKRNLRRCYELAIRGAGDPPTIRLDVQVTIGGTGRVSNVRTTGRDFGGIKACVTSSVRRWRFPSSGGTTQTQFPVVFQPQG
jgi:hypothetical protein